MYIMNKNHVEVSKTKEIVCNGNSPVLGHPKIYLRIAEGETQIRCPYCNKIFIYQNDDIINE